MRCWALSLLLLFLVLIGCRSEPAQQPTERAVPPAAPVAEVERRVAGPRHDARIQEPDLGIPLPDVTRTPVPRVYLLSPAAEAIVANPVRFSWRAEGPVTTVALFVDELPLQQSPMPVAAAPFEHSFRGFNVVRRVRLEGYDGAGEMVAEDEHTFVPAEGFIAPPPGFNRYVIEAINDPLRYPRDGSHPYCWRDCPGSMGMVHDVYYQEQLLWRGEGSCFCTGHTLELLLEAIRRWQAASWLDPIDGIGELTLNSLSGGEFYQTWQGYGVTEEASAAAALELAGIGFAMVPESWEAARPGDFVNLSRVNNTGHAVIFIDWLREDGDIVGLRYYGCNQKGDSHPDPTDPNNRKVSGPSFISERFVERGGQVLPEYLFVGHPVDPTTGY